MVQTKSEQGLPPTLGTDVLYWIEDDAELVHGAGVVQGQRVRWLPRDGFAGDVERCGIVQRLYELLPSPQCPACSKWNAVPAWDYPWHCPTKKCGEPLPPMRRWSHYKLSRPKGWSKSGLASKLVAVEAVGPTVFDGWDANGEPVGRPREYPIIRCFATEETQSGETYGAAAILLQHLADSPWCRRENVKLDVGIDKGQKSTKTYVHTRYGTIGRIEPRTASASAAEGGQPTFATVDETHLWVGRPLINLYETEVLNIGKGSNPGTVLETTTEYRPGEGSIAERTAKAAEAETDGVYVDHRGMRNTDWLLDRDKRTIDREKFAEETRHAYGDATWAYSIPDRIRSFQRVDFDLNDLIRKYGNIATGTGDKYLLEETWSKRRREGLEPTWKPDDGEIITAGFDGSLTDDHTGLVGVHVPTATLFVIGHWDPAKYPSDDHPGGHVPETEVDGTVATSFSDWDLARLYPDPPHWRNWLALWSQRHGDRVKPFETRQEARMTQALRAFREAAVSGALHHTGHPVLTKHILNAVLLTDAAKVRDPEVYPDGKKWRLAKPTQTQHDPENKIDLAVCAVLAWAAYLAAVADGVGAAKRKPATLPAETVDNRSVFEQGGRLNL